MLRDLGELALRVRDERSRENILEAIRCYEAGAFRAAIVTTWTAVAYDLIGKILELSAEGDVEAQSFATKFQNAQHNQNIDQLLAIERAILDIALEKFQFIDWAEREALGRLRDDRHKCAHPAFVADDRLFQPQNELARYYIATALDSILTKPPIFGKIILEKFTASVKNNLFPAGSEAAVSFVKTNFLDKIRGNFLRNFCLVIAKALLKEMPVEWVGGPRKNLTSSLSAIAIHERGEWERRLRHEVIKLEEAATVEGRRTFIGLMALIPSLRIAINQELIDRAKVAIESYDRSKRQYLDVFLGIRLRELRDDTLKLFLSLDEDRKEDVVRSYPELEFWPDSLNRFSKAGSFRDAEAQYASFISPFDQKIGSIQFIELLRAIENNGQIWDAAGTSDSLAATVMSANLTEVKIQDVVFFRDSMFDKRRLAKFNSVFDALRTKGLDMLDGRDCRYEDACRGDTEVGDTTLS